MQEKMPPQVLINSHDQKQSLWWLTPKPFDLVSSSLYLGILVIAYFKLGARGSGVSFPGAIGLTLTITLAICILLAIDRIEYRRYGEETPKRAALILLLSRILLIEGVAQLEHFYFVPFTLTPILYLIPPYLATLYWGNRVGAWTAVLAGTLYIGKETLYSSHWYSNVLDLFVTILFCFALVFLLTMARVVSREKASRQRAEQLLKEVARSHQQLTIYAERVADLAAFQERARIARDMHDSLGHSLVAINVQLEKALLYHTTHPSEAVQAVSAAKQVAKDALQEVRGSVRALRQKQEGFSCIRNLTRLIQQVRTSQLAVAYDAEGDETGFSQEIRLTLYRIAQEAFTNIQKHACAEKIQVTLQFGEQEARLCIRDDGRGFDPSLGQRQAADEDGYGLQGMRERISMVSGSLHLESHPNQGTTLLAMIPKVGDAAHLEGCVARNGQTHVG